jgi:hypothetical protein
VHVCPVVCGAGGREKQSERGTERLLPKGMAVVMVMVVVVCGRLKDTMSRWTSTVSSIHANGYTVRPLSPFCMDEWMRLKRLYFSLYPRQSVHPCYPPKVGRRKVERRKGMNEWKKGQTK